MPLPLPNLLTLHWCCCWLFPPLVQVARQEGEYLAALFSKNKLALVEPSSDGSEEEEAADADLVPLPKRAKPFR